MILTTTTPFNTMVAGQDQLLAWRITMTLPAGTYSDMTLAVQSMEIDASTTSDMPAQTRLQVGYPAMSARFVLGGLVDTSDETKTVAWLFGRYATTSPLYRLDALNSVVTIDLGLYPDGAAGTPEFVRKFTGVIDDYTANADGSVSFTCIEQVRSMLRSVPDLTVAVANVFNVSTEYLIDAILRASTSGAISTWPATRTSAIVAAGLRGKPHAEVGTYSDSTGITWVPGVFGTAAQLDASSEINFNVAATPVVVFEASQTITLHFELFTSLNIGKIGCLSTGSPLYGASLTWNATGLTATITVAGGSHTATAALTMPVGGRYMAADFTITINGAGVATWAGTGYVGGTAYSFGTGNAGGTVSGSHPVTKVFVNPAGSGSGTVEAVQVTIESAPASNSAFTPRAVLAPGLNTLQVIPPLTAGADPYQLIQQICDAELAVAGGDELGVFRFYDRDVIRGRASSRSLTSAAALTAIGGVETTAAGVVNRATVEYTEWQASAGLSIIWSLDAPTKIPRNSTVTLTATIDGGAVFSTVFSPNVMPDGAVDVASYYRASIDQAGTAEHSGLSFQLFQSTPSAVTVNVTNSSSTDAWLVSPANYLDLTVGTPLLKLAALVTSALPPATADFQYPPAESGGAKSTRFGEVANQISGNPWIQDADSALGLAEAIVVDMAVPRPNLTGVSVVPDPRLQLIDVVRIQDPDVTLVDEYARIFGWTITWEADRYEMTVDARTLAAPGGWIMGVAGRSEVGTTTYVYPSV